MLDSASLCFFLLRAFCLRACGCVRTALCCLRFCWFSVAAALCLRPGGGVRCRLVWLLL